MCMSVCMCVRPADMSYLIHSAHPLIIVLMWFFSVKAKTAIPPKKIKQGLYVSLLKTLSLSPLYLKDKKLPTISPPQHLPLSPASIHPDEQNIKPSLSCSSSPLPVHAVMLLYEHTSLLYTLHTFLPLGCQVKVT